MSSVETVLNTFGQRVIKLAKINIGKTKTVNGKKRKIDNTGALRNSLDYDLRVHPNSFSFDILMEDYGINVDAGRDGTKRRNTSPTSIFGEDGTKTGKGMPVQKLNTWIKQKPIRLRDLESGAFIPTTKAGLKSLSFFINRKIREQGIKPTNFLSDPFEQEYKKLPDDLIEAYGLDVDKFLQSTLNKL